MSTPPTYVPVADNDVFAKHEFTGSPWWRWLGNNRDFVATRGHVAVNQRYMNATIGTGAIAEVARFVWDRTPEENVLSVHLTVALAAPADYAQVDVRIDTDDTVGGGVKTGFAQEFSVHVDHGEFMRRQGLRVGSMSERPLNWPYDQFDNLLESRLGWMDVEFDAAAATQGTIVQVYARALVHSGGFVVGDLPEVVLRSVCAVGYKGG
tara:strand:- start:546 stop:1169 length:624 start_codon:yes stop_codon:yes gene_type:complete